MTFTAKTKREGQDWLRRRLEKIDNGLTYEGAQVTLKRFMNDWLLSIEPSIRYNTFKQYRQITNQHIQPVLGEIKLSDLKPDHIQQLYNRMVRNGTGLRTVQITHSVIHRVLVHAVKLGLISRNLDQSTTPPKPKHQEMKFWDENQAQRFLLTAKLNNDLFYTLYHLAIATGMRQGKLLGVRWADMELEKGILHVQRQLTKKKGGGYEFTTPKTKAGKREIGLGTATVAILKEHRQKQFELMGIKGEQWHEQDLMFPSQTGMPLDRDNLRKHFKRLLKNSGLPRIRFHDLRHTAASLMLNNGVPVIVVSRRLGHARPSITLDIYGHLIPSKQQEIASLMDQLLTPIQLDISN